VGLRQLLPLLLLAVPLLAAAARAADINIWASCDNSGVYITVSSDVPFAYTIKHNGNLVDSGQANSDYGYSGTQPGTYEVVITPTDGSTGKWAAISYDGSTCTCSGTCSVVSSGGGSSGSIDLGCSWCDSCPLPPGLNWICSLVCNLCRIINGLRAAIESIANFFNKLVSSVQSFGSMIISGINTIGSFFASIGDAVIGFFSSTASRITGFVSALSSFFGSLANAVYSFFAGLWDLITAPFRAILDKLGGGLGGLAGATWRQHLFLLGVALIVGGVLLGGRGMVVAAAGAMIDAYVAFTDPAFVEGIVRSPYLVIAAGAVILVYAAVRLRE